MLTGVGASHLACLHSSVCQSRAPIRDACIDTTLQIVETNSKAYAAVMGKKPNPSSRIQQGQMKLIALLLYVAEQKQKNLDIAEQLFKRLMLPRRD